ncbi:unnamed protein product [Malus baccata var. baccata]
MSEKAIWSIREDVALLEGWGPVTHDPITGNEIRMQQMWKNIHAQFVEQIQGTFQIEQSLSSKYKHLHKELRSWQEALAKDEGIYLSGDNLANEQIQAQMWFNLENKKLFTRHEHRNIVKHTPKYKVLPSSPQVVLTETPLHESTTEESPSKMSLETPIESFTQI